MKPNAFTEKGLYMMATILKSSQAVQTTLAIIETFAKIRELSRNIKELSEVQDKGEATIPDAKKRRTHFRDP